MSSSGSNCLEISEPKTAHSTLLSTYSGLFMAQQANSSLWLLRWSQGFKSFFVCGKPLMPEWVNMEETFWMRFVDLNRCRRATKYCRLVRWSCRWMVGRKGSTIWRNLFSNLNKRENDTLKKATVVVHVCSLWAIKAIVSVDMKLRRDLFWLIVWVGNSNLSRAAQLFCLLQDLREKWV